MREGDADEEEDVAGFESDGPGSKMIPFFRHNPKKY